MKSWFPAALQTESDASGVGVQGVVTLHGAGKRRDIFAALVDHAHTAVETVVSS